MKSSFKSGMTNNLISKLLKTCLYEVDKMKAGGKTADFMKNENEQTRMKSI